MPDVDAMLKELTLEEKAALCSGISNWDTTPIKRLGIPSVAMADGSHGLRKVADRTSMLAPSLPATCFPPAVTLASTWNPDLLEEVGQAIAEECLEQGVSVLLGPGVNIKRTPLCGRNFEYFSEDPYLAGVLAAAFIRGLQKRGVSAVLKHYAVNSQEYRRLTISSEIDERALREIYLKAFEIAVKEARPAAVMSSYNKVNGTYASEHRRLLWDILREEWGFDGIVISDWGAVNDRVKGLVAGLDLEMPSSNGIFDRQVVEAVESNEIDIKYLDEAARRILRFVFKCAGTRQKLTSLKVDYESHHLLARKAAAEGAVLLKNKDRILPLDPESDFAVIGEMARVPRYQGSGTSRVNPKNLVSFCAHLESQGMAYAYAPGYTMKGNGYSGHRIAEAVSLARKSRYVLAFVGLPDEYESEGFDRTDLRLPRGQEELIYALTAAPDRVVVVLSCGAPVEMPWLDRVAAVLNLYLGGEAGGEAACDLIFGRTSPSGKLAETFPLHLQDCLAARYFGMGPRSVQYRESVFVGYRYYDAAKKEVLFPFGFGLSYTSFEYSNLNLSAETMDENDTLTVSFDVRNTGEYDGAEVAQVYVRNVNSTNFVPEKELRAFRKVFLKKGEEKSVSVNLRRDAFATYNVLTGDWCVESGEFEILVGSSSRDILLRGTVNVRAAPNEMPDYRKTAPAYYHLAGAEEIPLHQFEALMGRKMPPEAPPNKGEFDLNTTVSELGVTLVGKIFRWAVGTLCTRALPKGAPESQKKMVRAAAISLPLRNFFAMTNGTITYEATLALLDVFNGKTLKGLWGFARAMLTGRPQGKAWPG